MTLGVLFSYLLSILILKEPCHKQDPVGILLMVIGCAFFVIFAKNN